MTDDNFDAKHNSKFTAWETGGLYWTWGCPKCRRRGREHREMKSVHHECKNGPNRSYESPPWLSRRDVFVNTHGELIYGFDYLVGSGVFVGWSTATSHGPAPRTPWNGSQNARALYSSIELALADFDDELEAEVKKRKLEARRTAKEAQKRFNDVSK